MYFSRLCFNDQIVLQSTCSFSGFSKLLNTVTKSTHHALLQVSIVLFCTYDELSPFCITFGLFTNLNLYMASGFSSLNEDLRNVGTGLKYCS